MLRHGFCFVLDPCLELFKPSHESIEMSLVVKSLCVEVALDVCSHRFEVFTLVHVLSFKFLLVFDLLEGHLDAQKD